MKMNRSTTSPERFGYRRALTLVELLIVVVILAGLVLFLLPPVRNVRGPARRAECRRNLEQIMLALHNYSDRYGMFPPAYTADEQGNRLHSWRAIILPFLDHQHTYEKIDFSKAWDDPVNEDARKTSITTYLCPESRNRYDTSYLAVVTPGSFFLATEGSKISRATDGTSQTLAIVEVADGFSVEWMKPDDADEQLLTKILNKSQLFHQSGIHVALVDGSVHFLPQSTPTKTINALITAAGKDVVEDFD